MPSGIYKRTDEHRKKLSTSQKIRYVLNPISTETRKKIGLANSTSLKGRKFSEEHKKNIGLSRRNQNHHFWKGDDAGYRAKHIWVETRLGKPDYCEHCKRTDLPHRNYNWANISGEYKRDLLDWIRLCKKCHEKYDSRLSG